MLGDERRKDLSVPLVESSASSKAERSSVAGLVMVTSAALLFGVVAAFVKATALPTLIMLQARSILEWLLGLGVAVAYFFNIRMAPLPQAEPAQIVQRTPRMSDIITPTLTRLSKPDESVGATLTPLLLGPPHLWRWLVLRALLYWGFLACWWLALTSMPIGDATTIVYTGPIWTATFARLLLGERIDWSFYPIVALDAIGLLFITQPSFLFGRAPSAAIAADDGSTDGSTDYMLGAASALVSAVIAGLLPVCTRKSKECLWTAVNHVSSALSALVFTPAAFVVWFCIDPTATSTSADGLAALFETQTSDGSLGRWTRALRSRAAAFAATLARAKPPPPLPANSPTPTPTRKPPALPLRSPALPLQPPEGEPPLAHAPSRVHAPSVGSRVTRSAPRRHSHRLRRPRSPDARLSEGGGSQGPQSSDRLNPRGAPSECAPVGVHVTKRLCFPMFLSAWLPACDPMRLMTMLLCDGRRLIATILRAGLGDDHHRDPLRVRAAVLRVRRCDQQFGTHRRRTRLYGYDAQLAAPHASSARAVAEAPLSLRRALDAGDPRHRRSAALMSMCHGSSATCERAAAERTYR